MGALSIRSVLKTITKPLKLIRVWLVNAMLCLVGLTSENQTQAILAKEKHSNTPLSNWQGDPDAKLRVESIWQ